MDPSRFWDVTPRLLDLEMRGAKSRIRRERELVWLGAMLTRMDKPPSLDKFLGRPVDEHSRVQQFHAAWDKIDRAMARH